MIPEGPGLVGSVTSATVIRAEAARLDLTPRAWTSHCIHDTTLLTTSTWATRYTTWRELTSDSGI